jgi:hypothetical protein
MSARLRTLKAALGGDLFGNTLLCPTIGHSSRDRGTAYTEAPGAPNGLLARVYNGNGLADDLAAKDRALEVLGEAPAFRRDREVPPDPAEIQRRAEARRKAEAQERAEAEWRHRRMIEMWRGAQDPRGTIGADYYRSRGLDIGDDIAGSVLRFHPQARWIDGTAPTILAALRDIGTGEIRGLHRTALDADGRKVGRKMFGVAMGCAVMLDHLDPENGFLIVGEGVETAQTARQHLGLKPAWALGSSGAIGALPVLDGVHTLIVLAEHDESGASARAVERAGERWHDAGRNVEIVWPPAGAKDLNDMVREDAAACR